MTPFQRQSGQAPPEAVEQRERVAANDPLDALARDLREVGRPGHFVTPLSASMIALVGTIGQSEPSSSLSATPYSISHRKAL
jgi:hypothetical protein